MAGDRYKHLIGSVTEDESRPDGPKVAVGFQAASISSNGDGQGEAGLEPMMHKNPHFGLDTDRRDYQLFEATPEARRTDVRVMDQVDRPGGKIGTLARYSVAPNAPVLRQEKSKLGGLAYSRQRTGCSQASV